MVRRRPRSAAGSFELHTLTTRRRSSCSRTSTTACSWRTSTASATRHTATRRRPASLRASRRSTFASTSTGDGTPDAYMVYEPYQDQGNAAVQTGVWQNWDAYRAAPPSGGSTRALAVADRPRRARGRPSSPRSRTRRLRRRPNCGPGGVKAPCPGSLGVNQGSLQLRDHLERRRALRLGRRHQDDVQLRADSAPAPAADLEGRLQEERLEDPLPCRRVELQEPGRLRLVHQQRQVASHLRSHSRAGSRKRPGLLDSGGGRWLRPHRALTTRWRWSERRGAEVGRGRAAVCTPS